MTSQHKTPSLLLISLSLSLLVSWANAGSGSIAVYWGQGDNKEGSLKSTCDTLYYKYVIIAFLSKFGKGQTPTLDLSSHCDPSSGECKSLASDITSCQNSGVKVLLSLGGGEPGYTLTSTSEAQNLAEYLWNNYLSGSSSSRPLGTAILDGIDFDIENGGSSHYDELAKYLSSYNTAGKRKVYLTAAPQCPYPDSNLAPALSTSLFDYVWVQFYNNPECEYSSNDISKLKNSWNNWTSKIKATKIFLGLPASATAADKSSYIPPDDLKNKVLPAINGSSMYGGIMLWNRGIDKQTGYSNSVHNNV